jgi:arylsulfatase A-like enzyme
MESEFPDIENVYIFVSDACRYDHGKERLGAFGHPIRTVAASTFTAPSFSSMISGVYPPRHGVFSWEANITQAFTLMHALPKWNKSLWTENSWVNFHPRHKAPIYRVLNLPPRVSPDDIEPPFILMEDDLGGHCPYATPLKAVEEGGCKEFFYDCGRQGIPVLRREYGKAIDNSIEVFKGRLDTLSDRGLLERTLVIFTSDHGELLGEHGGIAGHGRPASPELVYVPTVFMDKRIDERLKDLVLMRHVDLLPTLCHVLGEPVPSGLDGVDLLGDGPRPEVALNFHSEVAQTKGKGGKEPSATFQYRAWSAWDRGGGVVLHQMSPSLARMVHWYNILFAKVPTSHFQKAYLKTLGLGKRVSAIRTSVRSLSGRREVYGTPEHPGADMERMIHEYLEMAETAEVGHLEYSEDAVDKLRALGYME